MVRAALEISFRAAVQLGVEVSPSGFKLTVFDWFQDSTITQRENAARQRMRNSSKYWRLLSGLSGPEIFPCA